MDYDYGQGQAQNNNYGAKDTAHVSLREKMDQIAKTLSGAHSAMTDIEDRVLGSRPRPVPGERGPEVEAMPGVADQADRLSTAAGALHDRLIALMNRL